jgi:hypothetical protein
MKFLFAVLLLAVSLPAFAVDKFIVNVHGGKILISDKVCTVEGIDKKLFPKAAKVTNGQPGAESKDNTAYGCWSSPDGLPPDEGALAIVTVLIKDPLSGEVYKGEYFLEDFKTK